MNMNGARWQHVATIHASRQGAFQYVAPPGPARRIRFRFAGSPTTRGATAFVDARVQAATTIDVNRRDAVNGEYVTFRGRLRGGRIPPTGKLVELQVFTRRRWRTFALPRADTKTGRWSYQYRFETIRGDARFRFRARIRREADYPFYDGVTRRLSVTVHGVWRRRLMAPSSSPIARDGRPEMVPGIRSKLNYSNITATAAMFVALGGTSYAALTLPRNSVGRAQIRPDAVGSSELRSRAVNSRVIRNRSIRLADVSRSARDALQGQPGPAGAPGLPFRVAVSSGGVAAFGTALTVEHISGSNEYRVDFGRNPTACVFSANASSGPGRAGPRAAGGRQDHRDARCRPRDRAHVRSEWRG